jgi:glutamate synthase domain-containing protein 2
MVGASQETSVFYCLNKFVMKKFRFGSMVGMGFIFLFSLNLILVLAGLITNIIWLIVAAIILSAVQFAFHNLFSRKSSILKTYPFRLRLRHILGKMSPAFAKLIFQGDTTRRVVSSKQHELIVKRANNIPTEIVRNTLLDQDDPNFECLKFNRDNSSLKVDFKELKTRIGTSQCDQPYDLSILNIGALNQKLLKNGSLLALSEGANIQRCAINTGKEGVSPNLIRAGSDLIWQIAHEDYALRNDDSTFNEKFFQVTACRPYIKMIEIVLPRHEESIKKRLSGNKMIIFLNRLRMLSQGKPVGIRLFNPTEGLITSICNAMLSSRIYLDFITIDSTLSVSGFDSFTISNATAPCYVKALTFLKRAIDSNGLPTKILAAGSIISEYDVLRSIALGASACYATVPMILAVKSKTRFTFNDSIYQRVRVANFHRNTVEAVIKLMELCAYKSLDDVKPGDFYQKTNFFEAKSLKEIYFDDKLVLSPHLISGLN